MKEEIVSPDHVKPNRLWRSAVFLVQFVVKARFQVPRRRRLRHSDRISTPPSPVAADVVAVSVAVSRCCHIVYIGGGGERSRVCRRIVAVVSSYDPSSP